LNSIVTVAIVLSPSPLVSRRLAGTYLRLITNSDVRSKVSEVSSRAGSRAGTPVGEDASPTLRHARPYIDGAIAQRVLVLELAKDHLKRLDAQVLRRVLRGRQAISFTATTADGDPGSLIQAIPGAGRALW
jgi:hypothetical protein